MRERHNIVGSEVGRPRPPVYLRPALKIRRLGFTLPWSWTLPLAALLVLIVALAGWSGLIA